MAAWPGTGLLGRDAEHVAAALGRQHGLAAIAVGGQQAPQPRDTRLDGVDGPIRRLTAEELVDEDVGGHDLVRVQQEQSEQRALSFAAEPHR